VPPILTVLRVRPFVLMLVLLEPMQMVKRACHVPTVNTALVVQRCVHRVLTQPIVLVRVIRAVRGIQPKESVTTVKLGMPYSMVRVFLLLM